MTRIGLVLLPFSTRKSAFGYRLASVKRVNRFRFQLCHRSSNDSVVAFYTCSC